MRSNKVRRSGSDTPMRIISAATPVTGSSRISSSRSRWTLPAEGSRIAAGGLVSSIAVERTRIGMAPIDGRARAQPIPRIPVCRPARLRDPPDQDRYLVAARPARP